MKFRSPTDQPIHIALTTGQTALVTPDGVELDPMFHREAVARGAIPSTMSTEQALMLDAPPAKPSFDRPAEIAKVLHAMLDGADEDDFNSDGRPDLRAVNKKLGFTASRSEVDAVWATVTADNAAE